MSIPTITQVITTLPEAPDRSDPANFADEAAALVAVLDEHVTETNTWTGQVNAATVAIDATISGISTDASNAAASAASASASAATATSQVATIANNASIASAAAAAALAYSNDADDAKLAAQSAINYRATLAEGIADFAVGEYFTSIDADELTAATGVIRTYKRIVGSPYYEDQGDAAAPFNIKYPAAAAVYLSVEDAIEANGFSIVGYGASPGIADNTAAIQAAIDYAASLSLGGTVYFPDGIFPILSTIIWKPKVSLALSKHCIIRADAPMDAMLATDVGSSAVRVRDVRIHGGQWFLNSNALRGWWLKEYQRIKAWDVLIYGSAPELSVDGSFIELGHASQAATGYEFNLTNFWMYQSLGTAPYEVPTGFMGIRSTAGDGSSDMRIGNGDINGVKAACYGKFAVGRIDNVHVWNHVPTQGHLDNGFHFTDYFCQLTACQVDCHTDVIAYKFSGGVFSVYTMIGCEVNVHGGTDGAGYAVEIGTGVKLNALGCNFRTANSGGTHANYLADFTGDLSKLYSTGNYGNAALTPCKWEGMSYTVSKTADQLDMGSTFADVTELSLPMATTTLYEFEFHLIMDADATTTGMDLTLNGPSGVVMLNSTARYWTGTATYTDAPINSFLTASSTSLTSNGTQKRDFMIRGTIRSGGTAGPLVAQVRREAVGSGPNVRQYSWARLTRIDKMS